MQTPSRRFARFLPLALLFAPHAAAADPVAFRGAVGQGASATGGRGGDVYHVTRLDDYHPRDDEKLPGSLRHAIRSASGPRTIVFDIAGPIGLKAPLEILKSDLTIAGQTSPGGVTLWGYPVEISKCSNVVVRYLRIRLGDFHARRDEAGPLRGNHDLDASSANAFAVHGGAENIVLDHLSVSWGMDETLSVTHSRDITVQHCLIAESLRDSFHSKGAHGYGSLVRGELTPEDQQVGIGGFTFYRCFWAHHDARNPSIAGQQKLQPEQAEHERRRADVNLVNSVIYNWGSQATHRSNYGQARINMLANYFANGPAKNAKYFFRGTPTGLTQIRHRGNIHDRTVDGKNNGQLIDTPTEVASGFRDLNAEDEILPADPPFNFSHDLENRLLPAATAVEEVLTRVGASLWRDAVDERIIESFRKGSGRLINSQEETRVDGILPGIDDLESVARPAGYDTDRDGMPDRFERAHRLAPNSGGDAQAFDLSDDGYTNLEVFLEMMTGSPAERSGDD